MTQFSRSPDDMNSELTLVGYLNEYSREVMPIAATPLFQNGNVRYIREGNDIHQIDPDQLRDLENRGWLTWRSPLAVSSDFGRVLLYESEADVDASIDPAGLVETYLLPSQEKKTRNDLACAYIRRALKSLRLVTGQTFDADDRHMAAAMDHLARAARARPELIAVRALRASIADYSRSLSTVNSELAEFEFELSKYDIRESVVSISKEHTVIGRKWRNFFIAKEQLNVSLENASPERPLVYESTAPNDPLAFSWICDITDLFTSCIPLKPYEALVNTVGFLQFLVLHALSMPESRMTYELKVYLAGLPAKNSPVFLNIEDTNKTLSLWSESDDAHAAALAGRFRGIVSLVWCDKIDLENHASVAYMRYERDKERTPLRALEYMVALLEMERGRDSIHDRYRSLVNQGILMGLLERLKMQTEAFELAKRITAEADFHDISQDYATSTGKSKKNTGNAIESVGNAYTTVGYAQFGRADYEAAEKSYGMALKFLQVRLAHDRQVNNPPNIRLLDRIAFATYVLALIRNDRSLAQQAVSRYSEMNALNGKLTTWQSNCLRIAKDLLDGKGAENPLKSIRENIGSSPTLSSQIRRIVWTAYGRTLRSQSTRDHEAAAPTYTTDFGELIGELKNLYQEDPNNPEVVLNLLKATVAAFSSASTFLHSDDYGAARYFLDKDSSQTLAASLKSQIDNVWPPAIDNLDLHLTVRHSLELLAKYFLRMRQYLSAQQFNDLLLHLAPKDAVANMRKKSLEGLCAIDLTAILKATQSLASMATFFETTARDRNEAARLWFEAGVVCSNGVLRVRPENSEILRKESTRFYSQAVKALSPPHPAAVFKLAENLHLAGESSEAIEHLNRIASNDYRAAVLFGQIVCSTPELQNAVPMADRHLANALSTYVLNPRPSRRPIQLLLDIGCSLYRQHPTKVAPEWLCDVKKLATQPDIFEAALQVLLRHRVFEDQLTSTCLLLLRGGRGDSARLLSYYLGALAKRKAPELLRTVDSLPHMPSLEREDIVAITPLLSDPAIDSKAFLKNVGLWTNDLDVWWRTVSEKKINKDLLNIANSSSPKLINAQTLIGDTGLNELDGIRSVWVDRVALLDMRQALFGNRQVNSFYKLNEGGVTLVWDKDDYGIPSESDAFLEYSAVGIGARYFSSRREILVPFTA